MSHILALTILVITFIVGLAAIFFTSIGTLIILLGCLLYAAMTHFVVITWGNLAVLAGLYLLGEALEYVLVIVGLKATGASNRAIWGAMIGGIVGGVLGVALAGVGVFFTTLLGIFLGAFIAEYRKVKQLKHSIRAGAGGVLGRVGSIAAKLLIAMAMIIFTAVRIWGAS